MAVNVLYIDTRQQSTRFLAPPPPDSFSKVLFNTYIESISITNFIFTTIVDTTFLTIT